MKNKTLLVSALLISSSSLFAQTAPASHGSAAPRPTNAGEVVELSAFEVSSTANRGYVTTSSLTASRIAVPITELPSTVITINEKLIQDTLAVDMRDTFNLVSGVNQGNQGTGTQEQNAVSLRGLTKERGAPVLSTYGRECHSLRDGRFRYTRYRNGAEELYDHQNDPNEWTNLAGDSRYAAAQARLAAALPKVHAPDIEFASEKDRLGDVNKWEDAAFR